MADVNVAGAASGAATGAAVGTAIMPGIGTAIGALVGGAGGGFNIAKMFGLKPKGSNDNEYVAAVARDMSIEYDKAVAAANSTSDPATQQKILDAYNAEKAAWGNPSSPNRNVALGASRFNAQIDTIMANAAAYTPAVPAATGGGTTQIVTIPNNEAIVTAAPATNTPKPAPVNPVSQYMPMVILGGAIVIIAIILLKRKGK